MDLPTPQIPYCSTPHTIHTRFLLQTIIRGIELGVEEWVMSWGLSHGLTWFEFGSLRTVAATGALSLGALLVLSIFLSGPITLWGLRSIDLHTLKFHERSHECCYSVRDSSLPSGCSANRILELLRVDFCLSLGVS